VFGKVFSAKLQGLYVSVKIVLSGMSFIVVNNRNTVGYRVNIFLLD
jgi:hypothetical protein